jgi:hypothetical protein
MLWKLHLLLNSTPEDHQIDLNVLKQLKSVEPDT